MGTGTLGIMLLHAMTIDLFQFSADKPLYPHMGVRKLSDNKLMAVNQPEQSRPPLTRRQSSGTGNIMVPETNVQKTG